MEQKRIRILYTIPNFKTAGSGKSVYDLVKGLDRTLFEPEICCFHDGGDFFKEVESLDVKIHLFPFATEYRPRYNFLFRVLKISAFFKYHHFDVIHSWHWSSDISEPLAAKLAGIPYVYTKKAMGWNGRYWKLRSRLSSKVIAVNTDMIDSYFSTMLNKVVQFPLAIDVEHYRPMDLSRKLQKELGLFPSDFVIITVANLVKVKGIETLLEAVQSLKNHQIKVLIVGDESSSYASQLKLEYQDHPQFMFLGKQLDVRPYLALCDLFVIPTKDEGRREGIPNAPLEAMAMEKIVLGSRINGITDILKVFPDCMFQADNASELAKKITAIMTMSDEQSALLEQQMRERVVNEFSITDFIARHQSLYLEMHGSK